MTLTEVLRGYLGSSKLRRDLRWLRQGEDQQASRRRRWPKETIDCARPLTLNGEEGERVALDGDIPSVRDPPWSSSMLDATAAIVASSSEATTGRSKQLMTSTSLVRWRRWVAGHCSGGS